MNKFNMDRPSESQCLPLDTILVPSNALFELKKWPNNVLIRPGWIGSCGLRFALSCEGIGLNPIAKRQNFLQKASQTNSRVFFRKVTIGPCRGHLCASFPLFFYVKRVKIRLRIFDIVGELFLQTQQKFHKGRVECLYLNMNTVTSCIDGVLQTLGQLEYNVNSQDLELQPRISSPACGIHVLLKWAKVGKLPTSLILVRTDPLIERRQM